MPDSDLIHVAVGVIRNSDGDVLLAKRHQNSHQGGLWEFPGGKLEVDETVEQALSRELLEEINLQVLHASPMLKVFHDYGDKRVLLDVWEVLTFKGKAEGLEGQAIAWRRIDSLQAEEFPAANVPILRALRLPGEIAITPAVADEKALVACVHQLVQQDVKAIQIRQHQLDDQTYCQWYRYLVSNCMNCEVLFIANTSLANAQLLDAPAAHLTSQRLMSLQQVPSDFQGLLAASCHNAAQLRHAMALDLNLVLLSPVCPTSKSTPGSELGWAQFRRLCSETQIPVYALGGIQRGDLGLARSHGAHGIAGISMFRAE